MEAIVGQRFVNSKLEEVNQEELFGSKLYCLFFSGSWCGPCELFAKELVELYNEANQGEKILEVIQINFEKGDKEEDRLHAFKSSIVDKPWIFIPLGDSKIEELKSKYNVLTIPVFYVLDKNGNIVTETGRKELASEGVKVIDKWLNMIGEGY